MITLDLTSIIEFLSDNAVPLLSSALVLFVLGTFLWLVGSAAAKLWLIHIQHDYEHNQKFILLAIDIPPENLQTPKAAEQIFAQLHGAQSNPNMKEKWLTGKHQQTFSFEIVSIGGYIQFLIRTNEVFRDLVESAIYAQYPDAEITEIADYASGLPTKFPDPTHELWAIEFVLAKKSAYPIRSYPDFEHTSAEEVFKDPMAALLEVLSKLRTGEQAWLQLVIAPVDDDWKDEGEEIVDFLAGKPGKETKKGFVDKLAAFPLLALSAISDALLPTYGGEGEGAKKSPEFVWSLVQHLTGGEKDDIQAIEDKISKIGYRVKFRFGYLSPHDIFSKARGVAPVVGAIKQFNTINLNAFKGSKLVKTDEPVYAFAAKRTANRQKAFMRAFKVRSSHRGAGHGFILNIEELATVWHFPINTVRAPLVKKTDAKRSEPPTRLPVETEAMAASMQEKRERATAGVPTNLPSV